ncbi:L-threonine 3-O-phosphate decarboxylase [Halalkalibacter wakoensis JCM 9140]|uniref:threonine-phosphate decarboxylase n=1 Tax=Halalkalibacter wakoensis JCM 9140 TaxID=1236970 RepID=W4PYU4_9BACI|nr:threonine-phosphate decarboxylase CobD [Halalkalibacter wakoensis]GAE24653.1 L-threonine 3-O-phosphate decarboxylase [Halalkalibacter wakoensis JCM 9140]
MKWPNHGGQPETMKQLFNIKPEHKMLDFSANLNPLGPPSWLKQALEEQYDTLVHYPEPSYDQSHLALAKHEGIHKDQVLLTNGGAEAIFLVAKYFEKKNALIVHPTFSEYERACQHYHLKVDHVFYDIDNEFQLPMSCILAKLPVTDVIFLCRPNNPTGTVVKEEDIIQLLKAGKKFGTTIVVDEAFVDFLPGSIAPLTKWLASYSNIILLRSLTKMYTIPGLRAGYLIATENIIQTLKDVQIPWSINALVNSIIPKLLSDTMFVEQTKQWLQEQSHYVRKTLTQLDFYLSPSSVNFYLLQDLKRPQTDELFQFLLQHGIVTRHTHNFKGLDGKYIRIAVRSKAENEQFLHFLKKWRNE